MLRYVQNNPMLEIENSIGLIINRLEIVNYAALIICMELLHCDN